MVEPAIEIDLCERVFTVRADGGDPTIRPLPHGAFAACTNIRRFALSSSFDEMLVGLPDGEQATVELKGMGRSVEELRAGRLVVYLDQNHWSSMAAARFGHRRVAPSERAAAEHMLELVEAKQILLPASAGHLVETTPLYGVHRFALATTILQASRGWQMCHPVHVRTEEIRRLVQGNRPAAPNVFSPQTNGLFATEETADAGGDVALEALLAAVPEILSLYDTIVDEERIPDANGAEEKAAAWAAYFADLAQRVHAANESSEMIWRVSNGNVLTDLMGEILDVARDTHLSPERVIDHLTASGDPISRMPTVAQLRQAIFARLSNKTQKWESNDLVDINYLTCAAGYADVVVGERRATGYLRQARRPPPRARLANSLAEAVKFLTRRDDG